MKQSSSSGSSVQNYHSGSDDFFEEYDTYIYAQARSYTYSKRKMIHPDVLDMEIDELAQRTRIKVWLVRQKEHIVNPKAYIRRVVHNESVTMMRQSRPLSSLSVDEYGETCLCEIIGASELSQDPLHEVEQKETIAYYMHEVAHAMTSLPTCQQQAMLCSLKERVDDLLAWIEICGAYNMDIRTAQWPTEDHKLRSMRSSVSPARKKLHRKIQEAKDFA